MRSMLLVFVSAASLASAQQVSVPLTVQEPAGVARTAEEVTVGVPLPAGAGILSVDALGVFDNGQEVPAQFRVLSRWGGLPDDATKPIRWVLVDFQATLAGGASKTWTLRTGGSGSAAPQGLTVDSSDPSACIVHTGRLDARVPRTNGAILDRVVVDGRVVLEDTSNGRAWSGVTLVDGDGTVYRTANASPDVSIEEQGPLRVVLRVSSGLASAAGAILHPGQVRMTTRLTFTAGSASIRARTQLENNGDFGDFDGNLDPATVLNFQSVRLDLPLALSDPRTMRTSGYQGQAAAATVWRAYQGHRVVAQDDETQNFSCTVTQDGTPVASGARHDGWMEVSDGGGCVSAAVRWFWQNYEKALHADASTLSFELWPAGGAWPESRGSLYQLEGGRHKGYEMLLSFAAGDSSDAAAQSQRLAEPLVARAPGRWYFSTQALGMTDPGDLAFSGTEDDARMNAAYARYNDLMRMRVGATAPDASRVGAVNTLIDAKEHRYQSPGTYLDWYGWANFGDDAWGDGYSSNHYDLPGFLATHFLRLGDRAFWDVAEPHIRQACEFGQVWAVDPSPYVASISFYEKTGHGAWPEAFRPAPSHNWTRRLVLYYWLTGDPVAREAALFNSEGLWRYFHDGFDITQPASFDLVNWSPLSEARHITWTLDNWLETWAMTGDSRWMQGCEDLVRCVLYKVQQQGQIDYGSTHATGADLMTHYAVEPLIRFHAASTNDALKAQVMDALRGILTGLYERDVVDAQGSGAAYLPAAIPDAWSNSGSPDDYDTIFNGFAASLYAYVGWVDGNATYLAKARRLWADGVCYPEYSTAYPARDTRDRSQYDAWGWASAQFPGSDEKVLSRETREGMPFLWVMNQLTGAPSPPPSPAPSVARVRIGLGAHPFAQGQVASFAWNGSAFAPAPTFSVPWTAYDLAVGECRPAGGDIDGDGREEYALGLGRYPTNGGWIALLDDEASGFALLAWVEVPWSAYNAANGETWPAIGDFDGDGQAEMVVGLGPGGGGWMAEFGSASQRYGFLRWVQVPWSDYDAANGATCPAVGSVGGSVRIVAGLGSYPANGGWYAFLDPISGTSSAWGHVPWSAYDAAEGSTRPCVGDVDGSGTPVVIVGLGPYPANGGWMYVSRDGPTAGPAVNWLHLPWSAYDTAVGATRPALRDVDGDGRADVIVGTAAYSGGGRVAVLKDAAAGYALLGWIQVGDAAYQSAEGETWPMR